MGSKRLPGKVLRPLGDSIVLDYVVNRCKQVKKVSDVIVATSTLKQDDPIVHWCKQNNTSYFRGSETDVLSRYYLCAREVGADNVIRVTADCPFIDFHLASEIVDTMCQANQNTDYVNVIGDLPRGLIVEMFSYRSIKYIYEKGIEPRHREHVTYYAYEYSEEFRAINYYVTHRLNFPKLRITLDTEEDYKLCKEIANHFDNEQLVSSIDVVNFLLENTKIANINAHIEQKPVI